jgi:hypothetical protein
MKRRKILQIQVTNHEALIRKRHTEHDKSGHVGNLLSSLPSKVGPGIYIRYTHIRIYTLTAYICDKVAYVMICPRSIHSLDIPHTPYAKNGPTYGVCHQDSRNFSLSDASRRISDYEWERAREINRSRKLAELATCLRVAARSCAT